MQQWRKILNHVWIKASENKYIYNGQTSVGVYQLYIASITSGLALSHYGLQGRIKFKIIGSATSLSRRKISSLEIIKKSVYIYGTNTKTVGRLDSDSHAGIVCDGREFRKLSVTIVLYEVSGFGKELGNYEDVEVSTIATTYDDPITRTT